MIETIEETTIPMERFDGKRVVLKYRPNNEFHLGTVVDYRKDSLIVKMDQTARYFVDKDRLVDLGFNLRWHFCGVHNEQGSESNYWSLQ